MPLLLSIALLPACSNDDEGDPPPPAPVINAIELTFNDPEVLNQVFRFSYNSSETPPTIQEIALGSGLYFLNIRLSDNLLGEDLTLAVSNNRDQYQLFFEFPAEAVGIFQYNDVQQGLALGLFTAWEMTGPTQAGAELRVKVVKGLVKQPVLSGGDVYNPNMGGEIVLDAVFPLSIQ